MAYPALQNLIRGYFHQDYDLMDEDPDEIVRVYREESSPAQQEELVRDIQHYLAQHQHETNDAFLQVFYDTFEPEFGFYCWHGRTAREALTKIVHILSEADAGATS
jgi:hypothetical protein